LAVGSLALPLSLETFVLVPLALPLFGSLRILATSLTLRIFAIGRRRRRRRRRRRGPFAFTFILFTLFTLFALFALLLALLG